MGRKTKNKQKSLNKAARESATSSAPPKAATAATNAAKRRRGDGAGETKAAGEAEDLIFEDPFEDEFEEENVHDSDGDEGDDGSEGECAKGEPMDDGGDEDGEGGAGGAGGDGAGEAQDRVWRGGVDDLADGEELEYDSTAYHMYHSIRPEWPCLSFDVIRDSLGTNRSRFPHMVFAVAGTQADRADRNKLTVMKLSDLQRTRRERDGEEGEEEDSDVEETDDDPVLDHVNIPHRGGVNRVRSMPQRPNIVATWADTADVHLWDVSRQLAAFGGRGAPKNASVEPLLTFGGHDDEGFAMDWSPVEAGRLATGDCAGKIHLTKGGEGGAFAPDGAPYVGHTGSVEDLQWSPTEATVFSSASADRTLAVWDARQKAGPMLSLKAHDEDVNVLSWNKLVTYLIATGSDDGSFKIWDLRSFGKGEPVAQFRWHKGPITSIEWHPTDESMLAASGADHQLTLWDLSVEADDLGASGGGGGVAAAAGGLGDLPPQLLFIHQGQRDIKELHFHPQIPGVILSTAADGFNIFKPATTV